MVSKKKLKKQLTSIEDRLESFEEKYTSLNEEYASMVKKYASLESGYNSLKRKYDTHMHTGKWALGSSVPKEPRTLDAVKFRDATIDDIAGICAIEGKCFLEDDRYSSELFRSRILKNGSDSSNRHYFVAEIDGKIVGYGEVAIKSKSDTIGGGSTLKSVERFTGKLPDKVGVLITAGVDPEYQRQGIGKELAKIRMDYITKRGISEVFAHAWPNGGFPYVGKSLGFRKVPEWQGRSYDDGSKQELYFKYMSCSYMESLRRYVLRVSDRLHDKMPKIHMPKMPKFIGKKSEY